MRPLRLLLGAAFALLTPPHPASAAGTIVVTGWVEEAPAAGSSDPAPRLPGIPLDLSGTPAFPFETTTSLQPNGAYEFTNAQAGGVTPFVFVTVRPGAGIDWVGYAGPLKLEANPGGGAMTHTNVAVVARKFSSATSKEGATALLRVAMTTNAVRELGDATKASEALGDLMLVVARIGTEAKGHGVEVTASDVDAAALGAWTVIQPLPRGEVTPGVFSKGARGAMRHALDRPDDFKNMDGGTRTLYVWMRRRRHEVGLAPSEKARATLTALLAERGGPIPPLLLEATRDPVGLPRALEREGKTLTGPFLTKPDDAAKDPDLGAFGFWKALLELDAVGGASSGFDAAAKQALERAARKGFVREMPGGVR